MSKAPVQLLLWDALKPIAQALGFARPHPAARPSQNRPAAAPTKATAVAKKPPSAKKKPSPSRSASMERRYVEITDLMLRTYGVRVRKWRTGMSGVAWCVMYRDGSIARLIESPKPKGPMSMAVFLHEIGHHAIGFDVYSPRCLEEFHAWEFAINAMKEHGLNITDQVEKRRRRSLEYAVGKACRRGIKNIPIELVEFIPMRYRASYRDVEPPRE